MYALPFGGTPPPSAPLAGDVVVGRFQVFLDSFLPRTPPCWSFYGGVRRLISPRPLPLVSQRFFTDLLSVRQYGSRGRQLLAG